MDAWHRTTFRRTDARGYLLETPTGRAEITDGWTDRHFRVVVYRATQPAQHLRCLSLEIAKSWAEHQLTDEHHPRGSRLPHHPQGDETMARLDLIKFDTGDFGLQEVDDDGQLRALWDHEADQMEFGKRSWTFVRTLAEGAAYDPDESDDFWRAIDGVIEITPRDNP